MQYPAELVYNNINPKGFFSTFKQWTIEPNGSNGKYYGGQNVKILIQSMLSGVMDPYRSHLQITVECQTSTLPVGLLQLDSSAQSFIQQLVISSKNKQVQRIPQYSVLAAWLTDIGLSQMYAQGRQTQGLGYTNVQSFNFASKQQVAQSSGCYPTVTTGASGMFLRSTSNIIPTQTSIVNNFCVSSATSPFLSQPLYVSSKNVHGHIIPSNTAWLKQSQNPWYATSSTWADNRISSLQQTGYLHNLRAQYLSSIQSTKYCDSTTSQPTNQVHLKDKILIDKTTSVAQYSYSGQQYQTQIPKAFKLKVATGSASSYSGDVPNTTANFGFSTLYSPNYCKGTNQPFISPTVPQCQMQNGVILPSKVPISKRTFKVPLISAILGLLIPQDQFVLLPIRGLNDILMQIVLDKYAMFTSGYNDLCQIDKKGTLPQNMQKRAFSVTKIEYKMHTYQFYDSQIDQYLNKSLLNRILLNVNMWTLGNQYTIAKGDHVANNWPVACTSEALNEIVVLFVPSDYFKYSFCRKHFRISNNVTKFQLRVNMQYFPPQPVIGNGGNPCQVNNNDDNSNFIQSIFWSNNFMFNKVNPWPRINAYNFAINDRCYQISTAGSLYRSTSAIATENIMDQALFDWTQAKSGINPVNSDTAMGMSWIHQNRFVGKAGYTFSFQPYAHSAYHMTGIDCRNIRQFDVMMTVQTTSAFPRQQQMYIFTRSSVVVQFSQNGVSVYGK